MRAPEALADANLAAEQSSAAQPNEP
jgi:hypothetical protein